MSRREYFDINGVESCSCFEVLGLKPSHCSWVEGRKEGSVLFNDTLNTFYLPLYGVGHMVKDHSDSEKGNPLPLHRLFASIYAPSHRQDNTYLSLCYTSHGALAFFLIKPLSMGSNSQSCDYGIASIKTNTDFFSHERHERQA